MVRSDPPPKYADYATSRIARLMHGNPLLAQYFPDFTINGKGLPDRVYIFDILNTAVPNFVLDIVTFIERRKKELEGDVGYTNVVIKP